jgi:hypothetical protein
VSEVTILTGADAVYVFESDDWRIGPMELAIVGSNLDITKRTLPASEWAKAVARLADEAPEIEVHDYRDEECE